MVWGFIFSTLHLIYPFSYSTLIRLFFPNKSSIIYFHDYNLNDIWFQNHFLFIYGKLSRPASQPDARRLMADVISLLIYPNFISAFAFSSSWPSLPTTPHTRPGMTSKSHLNKFLTAPVRQWTVDVFTSVTSPFGPGDHSVQFFIFFKNCWVGECRVQSRQHNYD